MLNVKLDIVGLGELEQLIDKQEQLAEEMHRITEQIYAQRLRILAEISSEKEKSENGKRPFSD